MNTNGKAASLSGHLLATKGTARPAMRRPAIGTVSSPHGAPTDDLGWNDMGGSIAPPSPVAVQVAKLRAEMAPPRKLTPRAPRAQTAPVRKSAFTLRLDSERHLRLRLLSAITNLSGQQLLTTALDTLIARYPDIEDLAADPKARTSVAEPSSRKQGTKP